jgi:hypothetical protein
MKSDEFDEYFRQLVNELEERKKYFQAKLEEIDKQSNQADFWLKICAFISIASCLFSIITLILKLKG